MSNSIPLTADLSDVLEMIQSSLDAQEDIPDGLNLDQWLQGWFQRQQPALGGARPIDLLKTQDGIEAVRRALGAIVSGAYQ